MAVANTLAHYNMAKFTAMKSFVVQAPGAYTTKHYKSVIYLKNDKSQHLPAWKNTQAWTYKHTCLLRSPYIKI